MSGPSLRPSFRSDDGDDDGTSKQCVLHLCVDFRTRSLCSYTVHNWENTINFVRELAVRTADEEYKKKTETCAACYNNSNV